jgi:hypothetical protein
MSPKPAYDVLRRLIKERWWTDTAAKTNQRGDMRFRGTLGDYQILVSVDGKTVATETMTVRRGAPNRLRIRLPD